MCNKNVGYAVGTEVTPLALSKEIQRLLKKEIAELKETIEVLAGANKLIVAENKGLQKAMSRINITATLLPEHTPRARANKRQIIRLSTEQEDIK